MASLLDQTMTLTDGRTLAWNEYGDLAGQPMFYFHGLPTSRLEGAMVSQTAKDHGVRIISPDRPGLGLSSYQPKRTILSWSDDVLELADHLNLTTFSIIGASGGAPYVIGCLKTIPRSRLVGAGILCGLYPMKLGAEGMLVATRVVMFAASWSPRLVSSFLEWQIGAIAREPDPTHFNDVLSASFKTWALPDRICLENRFYKDTLLAATREAFRNGADGAAWEFAIAAGDWGFELEFVDYDGLIMFHGAQDVNTPLRMARLAAEKLKGSQLVVFDECAHLSCAVNHVSDLIKRVLCC